MQDLHRRGAQVRSLRVRLHLRLAITSRSSLIAGLFLLPREPNLARNLRAARRRVLRNPGRTRDEVASRDSSITRLWSFARWRCPLSVLRQPNPCTAYSRVQHTSEDGRFSPSSRPWPSQDPVAVSTANSSRSAIPTSSSSPCHAGHNARHPLIPTPPAHRDDPYPRLDFLSSPRSKR